MSPEQDRSRDPASILHHRPLSSRTFPEVVAARVSEELILGARILDNLQAPPILRAQVAVTLLGNVAAKLGGGLTATQLKTLWTPEHRRVTAEAVSAFWSAFSLHPEPLQGFRETHSEHLFRYLLFRELFRGRLPVVASDLKDTLAEFVVSKDGSKNRSAVSPPAYRGVRVAIDQALSVGPFFVVTGDTHATVVEHFICPNGWGRLSGDDLVPAREECDGLFWLPRTGMELAQFLDGRCVRRPLIPGISAARLPEIRSLVQKVYVNSGAAEHFRRPDRQYEVEEGAVPGTIEERDGGPGTDFSLALYPAGILSQPARKQFQSHRDNAPMLERLTAAMNDALANVGASDIFAKRGGLSTVDLVTSDKGMALEEIRRRFLTQRETLVFLGDRIALSGNDVEAITVADVSVQVGNEWDQQQEAGGHRSLLWSRVSAREGGAADYIEDVTIARRLGLTGALLLEDTKLSTGAGLPTFPALGIPVQAIPEMLLRVRELKQLLLSNASRLPDGVWHDQAMEFARLLELLPSDASAYPEHPFDQLEVLLLKRVISGRQPVLASDLKDTLAVFDADGVEWFPDVLQAFKSALQSGPYFLITGDSLPNLQSRFLLPAGILEQKEGHFESHFPGIHNLHVITRTGLDRVSFDFAAGRLNRLPLVQGISQTHMDEILDILRRAAERYQCREVYRSFAHEAGCPPGYVDVRGQEFPGDSISFAFFPAGVLRKGERAGFRKAHMGSEHFREMIAYIRSELQRLKFENVLAQQGGISTIDLTTATKGTALAQLRRQLLGPHEYLVYLGDTITQRGNDGSMVGVAEITVQVGSERDESLSPQPGCHHIHSNVHARDGGAASVLRLAVEARELFALGLWAAPDSQPGVSGSQRTTLPVSAPSELYEELLKRRPWEGEIARLRLRVPERLLPAHCPVQVKWVVLTGGTCAGKSTIIAELKRRGCDVVEEIARAYVEGEQRRGRPMAELRSDDRYYRQHVFELTKAAELELLRDSAHKLIFLDRSAVDSVSFHRGSGYDPHEIVNQLGSYRYAHVFVCNLLPFVADGVRTQDEGRRLFLDAAFERDYRALGYSPVRIPFATVEQRVDEILEHVRRGQV